MTGPISEPQHELVHITRESNESEHARVERLGRERPPSFGSWYSEYTLCFSVVMSQILAVCNPSYLPESWTTKEIVLISGFQEYYISGFNVLLPTMITELDIPPSSTIWPSTALSLVVASTLLIFGRLADMFGAFALYVVGVLWLAISSIGAGFSQTWLMLVIFRALQGFALAAFLPSGVMVLGRIYRPGPRKNVVFSIYGACAVLGFYAGIFFSGLCGQFLGWRWYFYIGAMLSAVTTVSSYFTIPVDYAEQRQIGKQMDWLGSACLVPGLVLFAFAIVDSSHAPRQWAEPYVYACLIVGTIILGITVYVEGWVAKSPLLPFSLFSVPYLKPLIISLLGLYGSLGIFLLYGAL